jgi:hypothetical protein
MIFFSQSNRVLLRKERKAEERAGLPCGRGWKKAITVLVTNLYLLLLGLLKWQTW